MSTSAVSGFKPRASGFDLEPEHLGFLTESTAYSDDPVVLRQRFADDGYLFLRDFYDRDDVLAARKVVTDRLLADGILDDHFPSTDGVLANVTVANRRSAFSPKAGAGREL